MPHSSRPIAVITLCFSIGILLRELGIKPFLVFITPSVLTLFLSHIKKWYALFWLAMCCCAIVVGILRYSPPTTNITTPPNSIQIEVLKIQRTSNFGHNYFVQTDDNETVLLQTSLKHQFYVGDSLGIYKGLGTHQKVLLRTSPKIHLEELIRHVKPETIIADGSNFPSHVARWKKTCSKLKVHFHHTATQGAYPLNW